MTRSITLLTITGVLCFTAHAGAQIELDWWTIDSGSAAMSGGAYELRATVGQPDAGETRTNAVSAAGGFWSYGYTLCIADTTTLNAPQGDPNFGVPDGQVTAIDLNYFVNLWVTNDPDADLTTINAPIGDANYGVPDGQVTAIDLNYFVNAWTAGCP